MGSLLWWDSSWEASKGVFIHVVQHWCGLTIFYAISHNMLHSHHHSTIIKSDFAMARLNKVDWLSWGYMPFMGSSTVHFYVMKAVIYSLSNNLVVLDYNQIITSRIHTLGSIMFGTFGSVWCKTALAEVGVSLPWWCLAPVLLAPGYWRVFLNLIIFS